MNIFRAFQRLRGGNVAVMTAILFGSVTMVAGGVTDVSSAHNYRADLQSIADRTAIYGARTPERTIKEIQAFADQLLDAKFERNTWEVKVDRPEELVTISIEGLVPTRFLMLFGMDELEVSVESRAENVTGLVENIEVALVLDTTESMQDDMNDLRRAALDLVDMLYDAGEERVRVSVVPYAGAVNIGADAPMAWMDTNAQSKWHAHAIENIEVKYCETPPDPSASATTGSGSAPACTKICGCPGKMACGGGGDGASLEILNRLRYASAPIRESIAALLAPTPAEAASHSYPAPAADQCPFNNPLQINHFELFDAIPNTQWMGCVETRPEPFDISDAAPSASNPDTLFVPFFWYDDDDRHAASNPWLNNYLVDTVGLDEAGTAKRRTWYLSMRGSIYKYDGMTNAMIDESGPDMTGPNRGCPSPVLPLTAQRATVVQKINALTHRKGGGTAIAEGLVWGWRTVSPGAPFTQGVPYDDPDTKKIVILLSDGANAVQKRGEDPDGTPVDEDVYGDQTAYGYAVSFGHGDRRRAYVDFDANPGVPYFEQIRRYLDTRTRRACDNIKAASADNPVEIFTVLVGDHDGRTEGLMSDCATSEVTHYHKASDMAVLSEAFGKVATEIIGSGRARITR